MLANILLILEAYGLWGLMILAFAESSFFPIFPDILLIPLCLASPGKAFLYAFLATIASSLGAYLGYSLGHFIGQPLLHRLVSAQKIDRIEKVYAKYGAGAVFIAGLAPLPYKIFTISSGLFAVSLPGFMTAALFGRGLRFFIEAILIMAFGQQALRFISQNYAGLTLIAVIIVLLLLLIFLKRERR